MKPEVIAAIVAAIAAVISAFISIYGQNRITRLTKRLMKQREAESREAQRVALISKYGDLWLRSSLRSLTRAAEFS